MKTTKRLLLAGTLLLLLNSNGVSSEKNETKSPKNVILLISDGTGLSHISAAFYFKDTAVNYARFQNIGLIKTASSRQAITDSGAGATAFSCGLKTFNGAIGVADDTTPVETL
jgi:alkaline phosphatase